MDLNNNEDLLIFLENLLGNEYVNQKAADIIRFFIITRNYGLIDLEDNIDKLYNENCFNKLVSRAIQSGFKKDYKVYNVDHILQYIITNYYENGFYFSLFPGVYADVVKENGLPINTPEMNKLSEIVKKYELEEHFNCGETEVNECLFNNMDDFSILKDDISLKKIRNHMVKYAGYSEEDYRLVERVINKYNENKEHVGIAFIEKSKVSDYFNPTVNLSMMRVLEEYIISCKMDDIKIIDFVSRILAIHKETTDKEIPKEYIRVLDYHYQKEIDIENSKTK